MKKLSTNQVYEVVSTIANMLAENNPEMDIDEAELDDALNEYGIAEVLEEGISDFIRNHRKKND